MNTLTTANGGAATFSGMFAGAGVYAAKVEGDAVNCAVVMNGTHIISEIPLPSITLASGTATQTVTQGNAITDITYTTANATGATSSGLPAGVDGTWSANTFTIAGTPTASGTFSYTVTPTHTNGCVASSTTEGTIVVNSAYPPGAGTVTFTARGLVWSKSVKYDDPTCSKVNSITSNDAAEYAVADGSYFYTKGCAQNSPGICPYPWRLPYFDELTPFGCGHNNLFDYCIYSTSVFNCSDVTVIAADCTGNGVYDMRRCICNDHPNLGSHVVCVRPL
jgi:hypothetical protein